MRTFRGRCSLFVRGRPSDIPRTSCGRIEESPDLQKISATMKRRKVPRILESHLIQIRRLQRARPPENDPGRSSRCRSLITRKAICCRSFPGFVLLSRGRPADILRTSCGHTPRSRSETVDRWSSCGRPVVDRKQARPSDAGSVRDPLKVLNMKRAPLSGSDPGPRGFFVVAVNIHPERGTSCSCDPIL